MRRLKTWHLLAIGASVLLLGTVTWRLIAGGGEEEAPAPTAVVTLAPVRMTTLDETVSAFGTAQGSAASTRSVSVSRAVVVERLLVGPGQRVAAGAPLLVVADAPASAQAYRQAADAAAFAARDLERVRRMAAEKLATNDQVSAAERALADARAGLAAQSASGGGHGRQTLTAAFAGVVASLPVAMGDHVAADAPLMGLAASGGLVAQLGVEPRDAGRLAAGQSVLLTPVFDRARPIRSRLSVVSGLVDSTSKLVNALAPVDGLPIGAAVEAKITVASRPGLVAPRAAVVFDENGAHVFVVRAGKARQVAVATGAEQGDDIAVSGAVKAGDMLAVEGAYELQDGMAVRNGGR